VTVAQIVDGHPVVAAEADRTVAEGVHGDIPGLLDDRRQIAMRESCGRCQHNRSLNSYE
jgi:hypothetical protein